MLPIDIQPQPPDGTEPDEAPRCRRCPHSSRRDEAVAAVADLLAERAAARDHRRARRGALRRPRRARAARPADRRGAGDLGAGQRPVRGSSVRARDLGRASRPPFAQQLLPQADVVIVVVGASLNRLDHAARRMLVGPDAKLAQIDVEARAIGRHRRCRPGDHRRRGGERRRPWPTSSSGAAITTPAFARPSSASEIASHGWRDDPYEDASDRRVDRPADAVDRAQRPAARRQGGGGRLGALPRLPGDVPRPSPTRAPGCSPTAFRPSGSASATRSARRSRGPTALTVAAIGDGGAFMALAELETAARLRLKLLVLIYDDTAYGAEVHHFAPDGPRRQPRPVPGRRPRRDRHARPAPRLRPCARPTTSGRSPTGSSEPEPQPLVLDAKVNPTICADWLAEAFRAG